MDRRRSYASVAGGNSSSGASPAPTRSGAFASLVGSNTTSYASYNYVVDTEQHANPAITTPSFSTDPAVNAPSSCGKLASGSVPKHWTPASMGPHATEKNTGTAVMLLRPSYLRCSRYMEKLEAAERAKIKARRESTGFANTGHHGSSGAVNSLSTSSSSVSLHKMAPSHRGMTYEIIESAPLPEEDMVPQLPSQWKERDRNGGLEISADGMDLRCSGIMKSQEHEAAAARTDFPIPSQCGVYYYEVSILQRGKDRYIQI